MRPWKKVIGSKSCHFRFIRIIWIIWPCRWWDDVMVLIFMIHNIHLADVVWYILKNAANPRDHYDSDKWSASLNNYTGSESWLLQSPAVSAPAPLKTAPLLPLGAIHVAMLQMFRDSLFKICHSSSSLTLPDLCKEYFKWEIQSGPVGSWQLTVSRIC